MNDQLTDSDFATIEALFQPESITPDTLKRTALIALAHDGTERALGTLERIGPLISGDEGRAWFEMALEECSYFRISAQLDPIMERLGDLKELPPAKGKRRDLKEEFDHLDEVLDLRGFCVDFSNHVTLGRRVAVLRAFLEAVGDLRVRGQGHLHIDTWYGDDSEIDDAFDGGWSVTPVAVGQA